MNKRKIFTLALAVMMVAILAIGGSLAYLTDTDNETNTFTVGKVVIDLVENFDEENAKILPGKDNTVDKEVWIELKAGSEDSYVWYTWAIPAELDNPENASLNDVHVNHYAKTWDTYWENAEQYDTPSNWADLPATKVEMTWDHDPDVELNAKYGMAIGPNGYIGQKTDEDGIVYNVYLALYHGVLSLTEGKEGTVGSATTISMSGVYMDANLDTEDGNTYTRGDETIKYDFEDGVNIIVEAYGIQAAGIADVYEAYSLFPVEGLTNN